MRYETEIEEEETMNGYKLLSELVADIIPPDSEVIIDFRVSTRYCSMFFSNSE